MWSESPHVNLIVWILVIWGTLMTLGILKVIRHVREYKKEVKDYERKFNESWDD